MFKTILTAAAFALTAAAAHASTGGALPDVAIMTATETAYYCEWVTVWDGWGNWVTVYECF
ncbi:hypothetical protein [Alterinioella nitratireducens]|jgi:hypothetical protein|uniref:hypothetical protein n=1 Tax=Alterinioella nitratireducens TaxID=2735915 RepID=UPI004057F3A4